MNQAEKIRALQLVNHALTVAGFGYVLLTGYWYYLGIAIITGMIFSVVGINIGFHRYLSHSSFQTNRTTEILLLIVGCLCLIGSPLGWAISHINHHAYADKEGDPYSPSRIPLWNFLMTQFEPVRHQRLGIKTLMRNPVVMFLHNNYFYVILAYCVLLATINLWLIIFCWSIPSLFALYLLLITNIVCHTKGYRNYDLNDQSNNSVLMSILTLGEGWHNNHHANPSRWHQGDKWWELDPTAWIIRLLKVK
jgi:stearoyl-CoA desaturase (delta-9 desaturase)